MSSSKPSLAREFLSPVENLSKDTKEYVDLKVDEVKLKTVKGLSVSLNYLLSMILLLFALGVVMMALAVGVTLAVGEWVGSYVAGAFIVAGVFAAITAIVFLLRGKMFVNGFVKMFSGMFFGKDEEEEK